MSRDRKGTRFTEWNGHEIFVTDGGKFYVESNSTSGGHIEANSLEALKKKIGQDTEFPEGLACVEFRWSNMIPTLSTVVKVTGAGNVMVKGWRDKLERKDRFSTLYVRDDARLAERLRLLKEKNRIDKALKKLLEGWPHVTKDSAAEIAKTPPPAWTQADHDANDKARIKADRNEDTGHDDD